MNRALIVLLAAAVVASCGTAKKGGYFDDDGPPRRDRVDVASIPDAIPREEPHSASGNSPYTVYGKVYYPLRAASDYRERGVASWYGKKFHGRRTSSGEPYDMYAMTAAHKTLPLPTYVRVRNLRNNRVVIVRVNDRGPFLRNRIIDLSYAAAAKLDIVRTGTGLVEVQAIDARQTASHTSATSPQKSDADPRPRLYLQVGAFTNWENAANLRARLRDAQLGPIQISTEQKNDIRFYRVRIGPLQSVEESDRLAQRAAQHGLAEAHVVVE
ncbi:MAG: septal ring lytic transglycosylase RlpA family protein [Acidiferrobacterales bacterium]